MCGQLMESCWKMHGKWMSNEGTGKKPRCMENRGRKHARKLSGKTCKGSEEQIIPTTHRTWRKGKERTGRGARWPAVSRQRVNPATGRDRAAGQSPLGLTFRYKAARPMPPTMSGPCSDHAGTFWAGPSLIRGEGFADWFRRFL